MNPNRHPHPSKEEVRAWMIRRSHAALPPPSPAEIRRELGWHAQAQPAKAAEPAPGLPAALAELAALTAFGWCWMVLKFPRSQAQN
jgi:hypothetical protein